MRGEHGGHEERTVSRRDVLKAVGAGGATVAITGGTASAQRAPISVQWGADSDLASVAGPLQELLWEVGLPRNINIDVIAGTEETDIREEQYTRWLSGNLANPDMLLTDSGWTLNFVVRDQLLNLDQHLPKSLVNRVKNGYFEASVSTATGPNGDLYAIPLYPDFGVMLYRKDLVEKAGYEPEAENWAENPISWRKFSHATKDAMDKSGVPYGYTFQADLYEGLSCCDFNEFMTSWGGAYFGGRKDLFGPIGERPVTIDDPGVMNSIRMIRTFIWGQGDPAALDGYAGKISPTGVLQWIEDSSLGPFTAGDAVMHRNWPYAIASAGAEGVLGDRLGVMPIPYAVSEKESEYPGIGGSTSALGGWHMAVNPNTEKLDAVLRIMEAMTDERIQLMLFENIGLLPPEVSVLESKAARQVPVVGDHVDTLRIAGANAIPRPVTVAWTQESTKIAELVHEAYSGGMMPEAAMRQLQSQIEEIEGYNRVGSA
ncbi:MULTISPECIES: extracellular solute-binding protein [unclassified Haladaptatus]|uniref:extracellular solute-binding protein n=1 Tax=unclassified Haladaptatus TaxID=2622732 RepID=UPI00209BECAA|nr:MULTISPECIES: extracellular solute-binding protein [unclassified Haladaptatus]MCO8244515.1 extracellular solute-binding protein [Haladaptatus sp. AB643]MCO8253863.1 extracellular solute-binding protein [Haladaptatus sp. AB618]